MVKISEQPKSQSIAAKRVSFDAVNSKTTGGDYVDLLSLSSSDKSAINSIERLIKVAQTLNPRRDGPLDITNNIIAHPREAPPRSATEASHCCSDRSRQSSRPTNVHRNERTELHLPEETAPPARCPSNAHRKNSANQQQQQQQQPDCRAIAAVGRPKSDVGIDVRDDDSSPSFVKSAAESSRTVPGGGGCGVDGGPRIDGGESPSLCRGYSNQRRHGRKASLGTAEIKRLIPTLVSENEEFRYKEYRRKSSSSTPLDDAQNLTI